jgi:hypothetical protein
MGKVPTATETSKKMSLSKSVRRKKYPQAIANWPVEERPREKLLFKGPEFLSNAGRHKRLYWHEWLSGTKPSRSPWMSKVSPKQERKIRSFLRQFEGISG